jgi:hypothetical protein
MYTLIDTHWIKNETTNELFHSGSGDLYSAFLTWCLTNEPSFDAERFDRSMIIEDIDGTDYNVYSLTEKQESIDARVKAEAVLSKKNDISNGIEVIALMRYLNDERAITVNDSLALMANADVQAAAGALQLGALESAKAVIQAMDISGLVITEADRTEIVAKIDEFLGV